MEIIKSAKTISQKAGILVMMIPDIFMVRATNNEMKLFKFIWYRTLIVCIILMEIFFLVEMVASEAFADDLMFQTYCTILGGFVMITLSLHALWVASESKREEPVIATVGLFLGGIVASLGSVMWGTWLMQTLLLFLTAPRQGCY